MKTGCGGRGENNDMNIPSIIGKKTPQKPTVFQFLQVHNEMLLYKSSHSDLIYQVCLYVCSEKYSEHHTENCYNNLLGFCVH